MTTTINNEQKKLNVPNLRFKEFQGEWEKCKVGDFGKIITGNTPLTKDIENYENGQYLWVSPADLGLLKSITETKTKLSKKGFDKTRALPAGSVLVTCIGSTIGKMGMTTRETSTNQQINAIVVNKSNNNEFVYYAVQSAFPKYLSSIAVQAVPIISKSSFELLPNYRPSIQEQEKIGRLFALLDERIATQSKVIEDLKKLKCAIIEKHYRQAKLHKYKICDLGVPFSVGSLSKENLSEKGHECILYGELFTTYDCVINEIKSHTNKIANMTLSQKRDLLFPSSTTVDAVSLISPSVIDTPNVVLGGDMFGIHIDKKFNAYYLSYYINIIARKKLAIYAKGSTIIHLHYKDIAKAQLLLPDLCEQDRIAKCMMAEDDKIKVEEQLMTKLEEQKQYLLRQMFI
ncbi:restriction endonuclease subunit S [Prevotella intermedia]|uniref:Type I restriction modification DNA specificity domain-containing protein n=1 Tax=Prevotella intermedia TaxID=28131 RepID=A0A2G8IAA2_PREIN|nr:restriction endonuclease subunit S [Prevotella intermedia]PIK20442.1 hypothetical protein CTI18_03400 [Prevotella intermedia]